MAQQAGRTEVFERRWQALDLASRSLCSFVSDDQRARELLGADEALPEGFHASLGAALAEGGIDGVRVEKRRWLAAIAGRDLAGELALEQVGRALADLADAAIAVTLDALDAPADLAVIAMGKLGGRELNYSSDIDLLFVVDGDPDAGTKAAGGLVTTLGEFGAGGQAYRIDLNLRPEGRSGALVRSLDSYLEYYRRWAKEWEFQALLKARACAGSEELGRRFVEETRPFVFATEIDEERVQETRRMKERVESHAVQTARRSRTTEQHDVKLGPGGIRDIEFSIQLFQLVHGGSDPAVRSSNSLEALRALADGGYVAEEDAAGLEVAYRWLRNVEHRVQLWQERQVHHIPDDVESLNRLSRSLGYHDTPAAAAHERFLQAHRAVLSDVRGRFEKLFYRPMIETLSEAGAARLSAAGLRERLRILGFRDVERAARHLEDLVAGTSRRAKLLRVLLPAILRFLAASPQPDQGLFSFLRLGEVLQDRLDVLGSLRDNPPGLELLAQVLGSGRLLGEVLGQVPEEIATIADPRGQGLKSRDRLEREAASSLEWRGPERLLEGLRRFKRREMLRIALSDIAGDADTVDVGGSLSDLAEACLAAALVDAEIPFAVVGMGKLGGKELNYASDIDVMFVFDGDARAGEKIAEDILKAIGEVTSEGQAFRIDAGLRPEGKSGPLARSLESYLEYYERWAQPWEHQALIKARFSAGDRDLGQALVDRTRHLAFPERLSQAAVAEMRHLKARMEKERIPRSTDPRRNFKLGPGGMSDIEFSVQTLQLQHAHHLPYLQATSTIQAVDAARSAELLSDQHARHLLDAYGFLARLRNRLFFITARPTDALPTKPELLEALGVAMGFDEQPRQELEDAYLRITRRARLVCEQIVFGGRGKS